MKVYHVVVERCEGWLAAHALEDEGVYTQGKTLEEVIENIREVADLRYGEKEVQIELILPSKFNVRLPNQSRQKRHRTTGSARRSRARVRAA